MRHDGRMGTGRRPRVEIDPVEYADKAVLRHLLELYIYDFSEYMGWDVDRHGRFGCRYLDNYWTEPERFPFFVRVDGELAGFALVRAGDPHDMAEFFVMRKYRRDGIGSHAARTVFARFPGAWQVRQMAENAGATAFWRTAIAVPFDETVENGGPVQRFLIES